MNEVGGESPLPFKLQTRKVQSRYTYTEGPMVFLGQQIVRQMQYSGWDAKIHCAWRPPSDQASVKRRGFSKAGPFHSPHQFCLAVDIIHATKGWPPSDSRFWVDLKASALVVSEKFGVKLDGGFNWGWDFAHIEIEDWRTLADPVRRSMFVDWQNTGRDVPPPSALLDDWFQKLMPSVWKQYQRSAAFQKRAF